MEIPKTGKCGNRVSKIITLPAPSVMLSIQIDVQVYNSYRGPLQRGQMSWKDGQCMREFEREDGIGTQDGTSLMIDSLSDSEKSRALMFLGVNGMYRSTISAPTPRKNVPTPRALSMSSAVTASAP